MHRVHFNPLWGKHPDELWRSERTPSRVSSEEGGTDGVYADGSLRANARYPGHVRSANRTYCRAHDSSGHFNISAECAEKTVERGPGDEKTKGKERKKRRMREGEGGGRLENEGEGKRERETGGEESLRDSATGLGFSTRDRWSGHGEPFVFYTE